MADFLYTARSATGALKRDRMVAKDERALAQALRDQGFALTSAKVVSSEETKGFKKFFKALRRVPAVERIFFTQNLEVMVRTGFSLSRALQTIALQTEHKGFRSTIEAVQRDVETGIAFSNALAKHPHVFSELFVNMVAAGEVSGKLDDVLRQLTMQLRKDHELVAKVRSALTYPAVVIVAMVGIGIVMMTFVIPKMLAVYEESQVQLPLPTRILVATSNLLIHQGVYVAAALLVLGIAMPRILKIEKVKRAMHSVILRLPIFGPIVKKVNIARFTRSLSSLLRTDIPIVQTFQIIAKQHRNVFYREAMLNAAEQVKKGVSIVKTLETKTKLFPPIVTQMISVGEESGTLDTIAEEMANFYEADVDLTLGTLSTVIEPVLILILGAGVAGLAVAVLLPMYNLVNTIS